MQLEYQTKQITKKRSHPNGRVEIRIVDHTMYKYGNLFSGEKTKFFDDTGTVFMTYWSVDPLKPRSDIYPSLFTFYEQLKNGYVRTYEGSIEATLFLHNINYPSLHANFPNDDNLGRKLECMDLNIFEDNNLHIKTPYTIIGILEQREPFTQRTMAVESKQDISLPLFKLISSTSIDPISDKQLLPILRTIYAG